MDVNVLGDVFLIELRSLWRALSTLSSSPGAGAFAEQLRLVQLGVYELDKAVQAKQEAEGYG